MREICAQQWNDICSTVYMRHLRKSKRPLWVGITLEDEFWMPIILSFITYIKLVYQLSTVSLPFSLTVYVIALILGPQKLLYRTRKMDFLIFPFLSFLCLPSLIFVGFFPFFLLKLTKNVHNLKFQCKFQIGFVSELSCLSAATRYVNLEAFRREGEVGIT